mmetsp:Transcript_7958/g.11579  ORF Transcript_7958/g.11579 Transcript_7958/m.11579 type:complete len:190 (-) Transcript_7958:108-677(-)
MIWIFLPLLLYLGTIMCTRGKTSAARQAIVTAMHKEDRYIGLLMPWVMTSNGTQHKIDKDKEYFTVATWGTMHAVHILKFAWLTSKIGKQLHSKGSGLIGETRQVSTWGFSDFRGETFTVWQERDHMAAFYQSGSHRHAMTSMKDDVDFRVRRVWVKGSDLPTPGDSTSTKAFVLRIKSGDFPEAVKKA